MNLKLRKAMSCKPAVEKVPLQNVADFKLRREAIQARILKQPSSLNNNITNTSSNSVLTDSNKEKPTRSKNKIREELDGKLTSFKLDFPHKGSKSLKSQKRSDYDIDFTCSKDLTEEFPNEKELTTQFISNKNKSVKSNSDGINETSLKRASYSLDLPKTSPKKVPLDSLSSKEIVPQIDLTVSTCNENSLISPPVLIQPLATPMTTLLPPTSISPQISSSNKVIIDENKEMPRLTRGPPPKLTMKRSSNAPFPPLNNAPNCAYAPSLSSLTKTASSIKTVSSSSDKPVTIDISYPSSQEKDLVEEVDKESEKSFFSQLLATIREDVATSTVPDPNKPPVSSSALKPIYSYSLKPHPLTHQNPPTLTISTQLLSSQKSTSKESNDQSLPVEPQSNLSKQEGAPKIVEDNPFHEGKPLKIQHTKIVKDVPVNVGIPLKIDNPTKISPALSKSSDNDAASNMSPKPTTLNSSSEPQKYFKKNNKIPVAETKKQVNETTKKQVKKTTTSASSKPNAVLKISNDHDYLIVTPDEKAIEESRRKSNLKRAAPVQLPKGLNPEDLPPPCQDMCKSSTIKPTKPAEVIQAALDNRTTKSVRKIAPQPAPSRTPKSTSTIITAPPSKAMTPSSTSSSKTSSSTVTTATQPTRPTTLATTQPAPIRIYISPSTSTVSSGSQVLTAKQIGSITNQLFLNNRMKPALAQYNNNKNGKPVQVYTLKVQDARQTASSSVKTKIIPPNVHSGDPKQPFVANMYVNQPQATNLVVLSSSSSSQTPMIAPLSNKVAGYNNSATTKTSPVVLLPKTPSSSTSNSLNTQTVNQSAPSLPKDQSNLPVVTAIKSISNGFLNSNNVQRFVITKSTLHSVDNNATISSGENKNTSSTNIVTTSTNIATSALQTILTSTGVSTSSFPTIVSVSYAGKSPLTNQSSAAAIDLTIEESQNTNNLFLCQSTPRFKTYISFNELSESARTKGLRPSKRSTPLLYCESSNKDASEHFPIIANCISLAKGIDSSNKNPNTVPISKSSSSSTSKTQIVSQEKKKTITDSQVETKTKNIMIKLSNYHNSSRSSFNPTITTESSKPKKYYSFTGSEILSKGPEIKETQTMAGTGSLEEFLPKQKSNEKVIMNPLKMLKQPNILRKPTQSKLAAANQKNTSKRLERTIRMLEQRMNTRQCWLFEGDGREQVEKLRNLRDSLIVERTKQTMHLEKLYKTIVNQRTQDKGNDIEKTSPKQNDHETKTNERQSSNSDTPPTTISIIERISPEPKSLADDINTTDNSRKHTGHESNNKECGNAEITNQTPAERLLQKLLIKSQINPTSESNLIVNSNPKPPSSLVMASPIPKTKKKSFWEIQQEQRQRKLFKELASTGKTSVTKQCESATVSKQTSTVTRKHHVQSSTVTRKRRTETSTVTKNQIIENANVTKERYDKNTTTKPIRNDEVTVEESIVRNFSDNKAENDKISPRKTSETNTPSITINNNEACECASALLNEWSTTFQKPAKDVNTFEKSPPKAFLKRRAAQNAELLFKSMAYDTRRFSSNKEIRNPLEDSKKRQNVFSPKPMETKISKSELKPSAKITKTVTKIETAHAKRNQTTLTTKRKCLSVYARHDSPSTKVKKIDSLMTNSKISINASSDTKITTDAKSSSMDEKSKRSRELAILTDTHWNESWLKGDPPNGTRRSVREQRSLYWALSKFAEMDFKDEMKQHRNKRKTEDASTSKMLTKKIKQPKKKISGKSAKCAQIKAKAQRNRVAVAKAKRKKTTTNRKMTEHKQQRKTESKNETKKDIAKIKLEEIEKRVEPSLNLIIDKLSESEIQKKKEDIEKSTQLNRSSSPARLKEKPTGKPVRPNKPSTVTGVTVNRSTGETALHKASRLGKHENVLKHLREGVTPNLRDNAGWTPLHEACAYSRLEIARLLLSYGADCNCASESGIRPIQDAIHQNDIEMVRLLLSFGADVTWNSWNHQQDPRAVVKFLQEFVLDLKKERTQTEAEKGRWRFSGTASMFDHNSYSTIFDDVPADDSKISIEFQMTSSPMPTSICLPYRNESDVILGYRNYFLLSDLVNYLDMNKTALVKQHKIEVKKVKRRMLVDQCKMWSLTTPQLVARGDVELVYMSAYKLQKLTKQKIIKVPALHKA